MEKKAYYGNSKKEHVEKVTEAIAAARLLGGMLVEKSVAMSLSDRDCLTAEIERRRWERKMANPQFPFGQAIESLQKSWQFYRLAHPKCRMKKEEAANCILAASAKNVLETVRVA